MPLQMKRSLRTYPVRQLYDEAGRYNFIVDCDPEWMWVYAPTA